MSLNLKSIVRAIYKPATNYQDRYHLNQSKLANKILKGIEVSKGKTSNSDIKSCDDYSVDVLGHKHFAPWLYVYSAISGKFKEGWIPDNFYGLIVVPKLNGSYRKVSSLKPLNFAIFQSDLFPDLLSYANGIFFDRDYKFVPPEAVEAKLFEDNNKVIFKLDDSLQGLGVHVFDRNSFSAKKIEKLGNGLFQGFIQQHSLFNEFASNSVATIRITTVYEDNGEVSVRACYLRFGSGDETHVQSKTHIRVPIDLKTGAFNDIGYTPEWIEIQRHPTSKVEFSGKVIPAFRECVRTVTELHKKVPYVKCVGWDVTVDMDERVRLIEWNGGHNGIKFSEATEGPCFADLGWDKLRNELEQ